MSNTLKRIGILGGTFDPVHHGHLQSALEVVERLDLDELRFMPAGDPPHKSAQLFNASERLSALEIALESESRFRLDSRELRRGGTSYSIISLEELRAENPDASITFIMGRDAWKGFASWHRYQEILELCHLLIVARPGFELANSPSLKELLDKHLATDAVQLATRRSGLILPLSVSQLEISSSVIRDRLLAGQAVDYLLPRQVARFLQKIRHGE